MQRRTLLQSLGLVTTHALFPSILSGFLAGCTRPENADYEPLFFSEEEMTVLQEIVDIILPATDTLAASEVGTHRFVDEVIAKCLPAEQQAVIRSGVEGFFPAFREADDRVALIAEVDQQAYAGTANFFWFIPIKQYSLIGFFTSREGTTRASNYVPVPGDYRGEIPLDESTLNYGLTALRYYI